MRTQRFIFLLFWFLLILSPLSSLDFFILNSTGKSLIDVSIKTDDQLYNVYFQFGEQGLAPGSRHRIRINTLENHAVCTMVFSSSDGTVYSIPAVEVRDKFILDSTTEFAENWFQDVTSVEFIDTDFFSDTVPEGRFEDDINILNIKLFNYTDFPVNKLILSVMDAEDFHEYLKGRILLPGESFTVYLDGNVAQYYDIIMKSPSGEYFLKSGVPLETTQEIYISSDDQTEEAGTREILIFNASGRSMQHLILVRQETLEKIEIPIEDVLKPEDVIAYQLSRSIGLCDLVAMDTEGVRLYIFDIDFSSEFNIALEE